MKPTVLLTGATGKLGQIFVKRLLANNWDVVAPVRNEQKATELFCNSPNFSTSFISIYADFWEKGWTDLILETLQKKQIKITHLVNNARSLTSLNIGDKGITDDKHFTDEFYMDVVVPYQLTMKLAMENDLKSVVNIGSKYGLVTPNPQLYDDDLSQTPIQYGVCKAALHHLTKELAVRLAPKTNVNCIAFGGFEGRAPEEFVLRYSKLSPLDRMLKDEESYGPLEFLLSPGSSSVTGHTLIADGGWSIW